jgi:Na+-driven multidrug efflux pump
MMSRSASVEDAILPLREDCASAVRSKYGQDDDNQDQDLARRVWIESKMLWHEVGPAIFSRLTSYSMLIITQAFAGHLGDLEFAATSIANNVVVGFNFGLLVRITSISHYIYTLFLFAFELISHFSKTVRRRVRDSQSLSLIVTFLSLFF